ncbi:hypothetical protein COOONC_16562 [Cooperia oncophora]
MLYLLCVKRIDDEYEDGDQRPSTCKSILPIVNTGRNMLFGGGPSNTESSPLIGLSHQAGYQSPLLPMVLGSSPAEPTKMDDICHQLCRRQPFFTLVYEYHQGGGFLTIAVKKLFGLVQFVFVVMFSTFFMQCVDYEVLFANKNMTTTGEKITGKRSFDDAIVANCASHLHPLVVFSILVATVFWILHRKLLVYNSALLIKDAQLSNLSNGMMLYNEFVQKHLHLKVDRDNITPFDLYNRILRFKNYLVALVNTRVLPPVFHVPFRWSRALFTKWTKIKSATDSFLRVLSTSPWAGPYLKDEYKDLDNLELLTRQMEKDVAM